MNTSDWKLRLSRYLAAPDEAWERPDERQVVKLQSVLNIADAKYGLSKDQLIESVIYAVEQRDPRLQSPVYLSNLGGCGSHWISRMMAQASSLIDVGEVYLPVPWYSSLGQLPQDTSARILDGVELIHGLLYNGDPGRFVDARVINSAHGYEKILFHRSLRPMAQIVHLVRDPRDRTMSVTFRKEEFRKYEAGDIGDPEYFLSKATRSLSAWRRYDGLASKADIEIRYEDFRRETAEQLKSLLEQLGIPSARALVNAVAYRNSPEFLRSGKGRKADIGNLDQGGIAKSWRELPVDMRRALHSTVAPALVGQGYSLCSCFPGHDGDGLDGEVDLSSVAPDLDLRGVHLDIRRPGDARWVQLNHAELDRVVRLRVRATGSVIPEAIVEKLRPWITDFCAAGVKSFDDDSLRRLGRLPSVQCMDVARTSVTTFPERDNLPSLQFLNLSGTHADIGVSSTEGVVVIRDY